MGEFANPIEGPESAVHSRYLLHDHDCFRRSDPPCRRATDHDEVHREEEPSFPVREPCLDDAG